MGHPLGGATVAIVAPDGVERIELEEPRGALLGAGAFVKAFVGGGTPVAAICPWTLPASCAAVVEHFAHAS